MEVKLLYFSWVREKIGASEEQVELPAEVRTIADLIHWQKSRGTSYERAFENEECIKAAIDQTHVTPDSTLEGAREVAFFPPVTGG